MCNLSQYIKEEGILQGRKEGRIEGIEKGKVEEKMDIAKKMKLEGFSKEMIKKLTGVVLD
ncbi:hypothetical protein Aargi30884_18600 [Amedibacterium intestinale]|uniref:Uncharacterized protein n=1 Tax=Amedibacterium intestinale TaxID=2583452 RepID=A0A6N4TJR1_9FIRM|nr:hypothetical protein [Amedibacterium intestinale]BBK22957.1 hypothetical protein Aargi30884_18600 [Amedibacterium intestinale]